ncbi:MAG: iron ABC transporter permease [Planctomycetota bacterium]|nr:MAG: iron ABC transporter permease [Planctomycetota bacterium]
MNRAHAPHPLSRLGWILPAAVVVVCGSALLGHARTTWEDLFGSNGTGGFWTLRIPRAALAAVAGGGLAVCGVVLQALFRNPLATPYTLGVASGASLGAACAFLAHVSGRVLGVPLITLAALSGAAFAITLVYVMARLRAGRDMLQLLLAGVCVSYMSSAGVMGVTYLANQAVTNDIVIWLMGSLARHQPRAIAEIAVVLAPVLAYACVAHRSIDLLAMGEEIAVTRGVSVDRTVWTLLTLAGVLTAVIVANCGPIAFVGLLSPHIARALVGPRALPLLVASAAVGAAFLALADGLARSVSAAYEPPVGVLTNIIGAAFFFYLLATRRAALGTTRF